MKRLLLAGLVMGLHAHEAAVTIPDIEAISVTKTATNKRSVVDTIVARVNGVNILQSDVDKPQIMNEGQPLPLQDLIAQELLVQHAAKMHMAPSLEDVNRQVASFREGMKKQLNVDTLDEEMFVAELKKYGFTPDEYKQQVGRSLAITQVKRAEESEKAVVSFQDVEAAYKKHPEYVEEAYHIELCTIPNGPKNHADFGTSKTAVWDDLGWIKPKDLSSDLKIVTTHKTGEIIGPVTQGDDTRLIKLVEKRERRLKTLAEAYSSIERKIQRKRGKTIFENLEKRLRESASIVYLT